MDADEQPNSGTDDEGAESEQSYDPTNPARHQKPGRAGKHEGGGEKGELEEARQHANPSWSDKIVNGGDRVSTEERGNPQE